MTDTLQAALDLLDDPDMLDTDRVLVRVLLIRDETETAPPQNG